MAISGGGTQRQRRGANRRGKHSAKAMGKRYGDMRGTTTNHAQITSYTRRNRAGTPMTRQRAGNKLGR